jgi:hypothetical protein
MGPLLRSSIDRLFIEFLFIFSTFFYPPAMLDFFEAFISLRTRFFIEADDF